MRRGRPHPQSRPAARWWLALLAVASLLLAPVLVSPAHAAGPVHDLGCGMDAPVHAASKASTHDRGAACAAACAVCAQLAPARQEAASAPPARIPASVSYPRAELRLAGVEPESGTPPPR